MTTLGLIETFCRAIKPETKLPPDAWSAKHVRTGSDLAERYAPALAPWFITPMRRMFDNRLKEVHIVAPPGSGKTALLEATICYLAGNDPGDTLIATKNEEMLRVWLDTRFRTIIKRCSPLKELLEGGETDQKKLILFSHMFVAARPANAANLQQISVRWAFGDECWQWDSGTINYLRRRLHDRWNGRLVLVSQAGDYKSEWRQVCESGNRFEYHWRCGCGSEQPYDFAQLKWGAINKEGGQLDWKATRETVRLVCPACGCEYRDTPTIRRKLSAEAIWKLANEGDDERRETYTVPAMANFRVSWKELVAEHLAAEASVAAGDLGPRMQFQTQRLSQWWKEDDADQLPDGRHPVLSNYKMADCWSGDPIDNEAHRVMTIDRQKDHFWALVRAWRHDGSSKLLYFGKTLTPEQNRQIQERYKVEDSYTLEDAQYNSAGTYDDCVRYGWRALQGVAFDSKVRLGTDKNGREIIGWRPYSRGATVLHGNGRLMLIHWNSAKLKNILVRFRDGKAFRWEVPSDVGDEYLSQVNSEVRREEITKTGRRHWLWKKVRPNHAWDLENMQLLGAMFKRLFDFRKEFEEYGEEESETEPAKEK
jgi:hypothetical protein